MANKRIAVLSLSSSSPRLMLAGVQDGQVSIVKCEELPRSMLTLKIALPKKLKKLKDSGFVLLVDEVIPHFAKYGRAVSLHDLDGQGRPIVVAAMQAYNNLKTLEAITFPNGEGGRFDISSSLVDEVRGTDGKPVYNIDWNELRPDTYALLFTVYAATQDNALDASTLKDIFTLLGASKPEPTKENGMIAVFKGRADLLGKEGRQ